MKLKRIMTQYNTNVYIVRRVSAYLWSHVSAPASIETSDVISTPEVIVNETITLFCPAAGVPPPEVTWFRDQQPFDNQTDDGIVVLDDGWRLYIPHAGVSHASRYSCRAENIAGISEKHFDLNVLGKSS